MTSPWWRPADEAEIQRAIDEGLLREDNHFDAKRELGGEPKDRKELARDLASFATNGGSLLVGVEELKDQQTWRLAPQPLAGLLERVEQVAAQVIEPPLYVLGTEIPAGTAEGAGYLRIDVTPSPVAPHMVDGIYYGRGDRTRHRLSDADVLRLHASRRPIDAQLEAMLQHEEARDHVPVDDRQTGRLYLVAHPLTAPTFAARNFLRQRPHAALLDLVRGAEQHLHEDVGGYAPHPQCAESIIRRSDGVALVSHSASGPGRTLTDDTHDPEEGLLEIGFRHDGGIRVTCGRHTAAMRTNRVAQLEVILDGLAVGYALRLPRWASGIAERIGYRGAWGLGGYAVGLRGLQSSVTVQDLEARYSAAAYDAGAYMRTTTATLEELDGNPAAVAERLVGDLVHTLGTERRFGPHLALPTGA